MVQALHARAARACGKISAGGVTRPAPTWPTPATRPAMPVLICGRMPVRHTLLTSMPVGVPWNSRTGILPQINTGMAGRVAGVGQVGAGLVTPPAEIFPKALAALAARV